MEIETKPTYVMTTVLIYKRKTRFFFVFTPFKRK